jgi:predicted nucleotidyltransferase component of viral defense system
MKNSLYTNCLPEKGLNVLAKLKGIVNEYHFVLAGGTALALQIGHRLSVDLDFFTQQEFSTETLFQRMTKLGLRPEILQEEYGTLTTVIDGVKISMFHYPYPFIDIFVEVGGVSASGILDVAAMKVIAIGQRGAKRDFVDLYFILQNVPFWKIAENMVERFGTERINPVHIGKSLVYFNDADTDPEPKYIVRKVISWETIRIFFKKNVKQMVIDLQKAKI